jgi:UDP-N-acetylmuramoyl-tripeptide--D-alanyl-D-alanine ligase
VSWQLAEILAATGGECLRWGPGPFVGISTDSRRTEPGEAFVALRGPSFDGHDFVARALERGATAAIVARELELPFSAATILVDDGLRALGELAAARRRTLPVRIVGVTGSNGKTTTKEMIAAVLAASGAKVAKSRGTENNLVGLPQTILRLDGDEDFAVLEMGMNHPGEIWRLAEIARPDVGVITNVGPAHLEGLGSLANVAAAKEELALALPSRATLVVDHDDPRLAAIAERFTGRKILVGDDAPIRAISASPMASGQRIEVEVEGAHAVVELRALGAHNVRNALLAIAVGRALGLELRTIVEGLRVFAPPPMRLETVTLPNGARILNDAYNANPASMQAALAALGAEAGRKIAVLGEMWELGDEAPRYHREVGRAAGRAGIDGLVTVGRHAGELADGAIEAGLAGGAVVRCATVVEAAEWLAARLDPGDVVLIKGSRGARMEEIVGFLRDRR